MGELASRQKGQPAPAWAVWEALTEPHRDPTRVWLVLQDGETAPTVIEAVRPTLVVWSSLWPDRPKDTVRFQLTGAGNGSVVRWAIESPDPPPDEERLAVMRHRMNYLINGGMRGSFGQ